MTGPSGRENAPAARLTQCNENQIVSERPWYGRVIGLLFVLMGLIPVVLGADALLNAIHGQGSIGSLIAGLLVIAFGLAFVVAGNTYFGPAALLIDLTTGAYREVRGWRPLRRTVEGNREDFDQICLETFDGGRGDVALQLYWTDPSRKPFTLHSGVENDCIQRGITVARLLRIPFSDEDGIPFRYSSEPSDTRGVRTTRPRIG
jgi:hypothetical protein